MKSIMIVILSSLLLTTGATAQQSPKHVDDVLKAAYQKARKENKNVFVMFHASWCGWCHKMDSAMNSSECKDLFLNNYVITHLVVNESADKKKLENPGATAVLKKYHGENMGIPFWLILDKNGHLIADSKKGQMVPDLIHPGKIPDVLPLNRK